MVTMNNLRVCYAQTVALDMCREIRIERGDRIGVIGSNGAGKTTFVKTLLGLVPFEGSLKMGIDSSDIAVHMQSNEYADGVKIRYIIEMILHTDIEANQELLGLIAFFNFEGCLQKKYKHLSGGEKQRLTLILVLMQNKKLTIFDEVTSGLDFDTRNRLMTKITDWYRDRDNSLILVSHYYEELQNIVDKIMIIEKGKVLAFGTVDELFAAYCGTSVISTKKNAQTIDLLQPFNRINAAENWISVSVKNKEEELALVKILLENDVDFKRSSNSIELIELNVKEKKNEN